MEVPNSPEMVKKTDRRGILRYGYFIDAWSEVNISMYNNNLPPSPSENITVSEAGS